MESFDLNKLFCAILGTIFVVMSLSLVSEAIFHHDTPEQFGYAVEGAEPTIDGGGPIGPAYDPIAPLMASADASAGEVAFSKCKNCHGVEDDGKKRAGPHLYEILNRPIAAIDDFRYSSALTSYAEGGKTWTYEELNGFLYQPKRYVKGTAMAFGGLKKNDERANIIAYLRSLSASPAPLPEVKEPEAEAASSNQ